MAKPILETFQRVQRLAIDPTELELDPKESPVYWVSNLYQRTLTLLTGITSGGIKTISATNSGALHVAVVSSGLESYSVVSGDAEDTYATADTFTFTQSVNRWDVLIENNEAVISFRNSDTETYGADRPLPVGFHSIDFVADGIKVKNRTALAVALYNITAQW